MFRGDAQIGDTYEFEIDGRAFTAKIEYDPNTHPADYDYSKKQIRQWENDEWCFVGLIVSAHCPHCGMPSAEEEHSLWGIGLHIPGYEEECVLYLNETARELAIAKEEAA